MHMQESAVPHCAAASLSCLPFPFVFGMNVNLSLYLVYSKVLEANELN